MSSNFLLLRDGALDDPSRLDLAAIEVQMAWPSDRAWQQRAFHAIVAEHLAQHVEEAPREDYRDLYYLAKDALPVADVRKEFTKQAKKASLVGMLLHDLVGCTSMNVPGVTMGGLITRVLEPYKKTRTGGHLRISPKSFQNLLWPEFRCVAHYWAASLKARDEGQPFPCRVERLREFLADAEAYRIAGERARTKKAPSTVLDPNETMKLPPAFAVSPSEFDFERDESA